MKTATAGATRVTTVGHVAEEPVCLGMGSISRSQGTSKQNPPEIHNQQNCDQKQITAVSNHRFCERSLIHPVMGALDLNPKGDCNSSTLFDRLDRHPACWTRKQLLTVKPVFIFIYIKVETPPQAQYPTISQYPQCSGHPSAFRSSSSDAAVGMSILLPSLAAMGFPVSRQRSP